MFDVKALEIFYDEISVTNGVSVSAFQKRLVSLFAGQRTDADIKDYRLGKKPWKKLRDEIVPISSFLEFYNVEANRIRFPLDNKTPDCWLLNDKVPNLGIEVTIERGREQYHLATELNNTGVGRGFIGMQDDASKTDFDNRMSNARIMFTSEQALEAMKAGILRCLARKNDPKYKDVSCLLIQAHLISLPKEHWCAIKEELSEVAKSLHFQNIYVIGDTHEKPWGFQIK